VKWFRSRQEPPDGSASPTERDAALGRAVVEESPELVVVLDAEGRVLSASRRAREAIPVLEVGNPVPPEALEGRRLLELPLDGRTETLVYLREAGGVSAYEELRAGFTAAVSHELRTPLARLLALLEWAELPGANPRELVEQARAELAQMGELIDDLLFLSELETGRQVVSLGRTRVLPVAKEVVAGARSRALSADVRLELDVEPEVHVPLRPRMLRVVLENLVENALRHAGAGATLSLSAREEEAGRVTLAASDDGAGVADADLPRLFERFYRADRARATRGTGLGLAIVKHVVTAAGGEVEAAGSPRRGLEIRCTFPDRRA
jgi:signal transduction histidine kinase